MPSRAALLLSLIPALGAAGTTVLTDTFEPGAPGLAWTSQPAGNFATVDAADEPRLSGVTLPASGERVGRLGQDGSTAGVISALTGPAHRDMAVQAWVFCEGSGGTVRGGYQGILARASFTGGQRFVRLAWDPDQAEPGQAGDGWVKLQAFNGSTWDYLGIAPSLGQDLRDIGFYATREPNAVVRVFPTEQPSGVGGAADVEGFLRVGSETAYMATSMALLDDLTSDQEPNAGICPTHRMTWW